MAVPPKDEHELVMELQESAVVDDPSMDGGDCVPAGAHIPIESFVASQRPPFVVVDILTQLSV